ncbi:MAG: Fic family protein [Bacteroidota bacterium]|nr:Fic family protein [Bacteroidota bacterium]MDE2958294.1 Fic family protein [Bacteroidota bacterium]
MSRIGRKVVISTTGERAEAYVPPPLPPAPPVRLDELAGRIERANLAIGRLDGVASILPDAPIFLYTYIRKEAVLSSQIEGTQSSLSDLLLYEVDGSPGVPVDDVTEVSNYVAAMAHGLQRIAGGFPLSQRLIREIHAVLLSKGRGSNMAPGEYRRSQNWIGGSRPGNAVFVPPPPGNVADLMSDLERFIHADDPQLPTLMRAGLVHVQFETIHPFLDGNGRLGRLLITLVLCISGVLKQPLLYLSLYFKTHRSRYYELLQRVRTHGDWEAWLEFFLDGVTTTSTQATDTARKILGLFESDREKIKQLGRPASSALRVHRFLQERPIATASLAAATVGLAPPTVRRAIQHLVDLGIVREITGKKRYQAFIYDAYWMILSKGVESAA